ncbi:hypothetical protein [Pseudidiomarina homiensis]
MTMHVAKTTIQKAKQHKKAVSGFLVAGLFVSMAMFSNDGTGSITTSEEACKQLLNNAEQPTAVQQCVSAQPAKDLSWASWFGGGSRSTQFHFLDLFELLFGSNEQQSNQYGSSKKVSL